MSKAAGGMMWSTSADHGRTINWTTLTPPVDLEQLLGPRRFELYKVVPNGDGRHLEQLAVYRVQRVQAYKVVPITVVYSIIFATGVVGNVCTAVVICRNKYMHTATNYYLCNLVLSDLLVLALGLPVETYSFWSAYPTTKLTGRQPAT